MRLEDSQVEEKKRAILNYSLFDTVKYSKALFNSLLDNTQKQELLLVCDERIKELENRESVLVETSSFD